MHGIEPFYCQIQRLTDEDSHSLLESKVKRLYNKITLWEKLDFIMKINKQRKCKIKVNEYLKPIVEFLKGHPQTICLLSTLF